MCPLKSYVPPTMVAVVVTLKDRDPNHPHHHQYQPVEKVNHVATLVKQVHPLKSSTIIITTITTTTIITIQNNINLHLNLVINVKSCSVLN